MEQREHKFYVRTYAEAYRENFVRKFPCVYARGTTPAFKAIKSNRTGDGEWILSEDRTCGTT